MSKKNKPSIRFTGFTDDWEQRKLSEIASMHARIGWQNLRTSEFLDYGDYMLITGTDFEDGRINFSTCHYVKKERYDQDKHIQIDNGSILITKDGTLGKVAYVQGLKKPATLNAGVFNVEIKDEKNLDRKYLFQYLKAPFLMDYVSQMATGGTIKHLNQNILVDFPVVMPKKCEQERIGRYFEGIDNLITLHQCKHDKLVNVKKSMLEKIFPREGAKVPELRFAGFTDDWAQCKLEDMCLIITKQTGFDYSATIKPSLVTTKEVDTYSFIQNKDFEGLNINLNTDFYIPISVAEKYPKITLDQPSLLISISGRIGNIALYSLQEKAFIGGAVGICKLKDVNMGKIAMYELMAPNGQKYFASLIKASSHANITVEDIRNIAVMLPKDKKEIIKLNTFMDNLDNLIILHQCKVEKLKNIKISMMKKMFV